MSLFSDILAYRGFIWANVRREFQSKYRNSLLGAAWTIINPLAMILVYTLIFSRVMQSRLPGVDSDFGYSIYLCAGLLTWGLFTEVVSRLVSLFIDQANLIKKVNFPRICLPMIVVANGLVNFSIVFGLFTIFLLLSGNFPGWPFIAMLPVVLLQLMMSVGLGIGLGVINVFFRDVGQALGVLLQFWFWLTPIVYPVTILPEWVRGLIALNPMAPIIMAYQRTLLHGEWPDWSSLLPVCLLSVLVCWWGAAQFRKHKGDMVDEL